MSWSFIVNSIFLGVGLAMDAFSVSLANGLNEPKMSPGKVLRIAGVFAFFQALMPMTGWFFVRRMLEVFRALAPFIPWVSLISLVFIGGCMVWEGFHDDPEKEAAALGAASLLMQGVATSIDALSVGFTIAEYSLALALLASGIIATVTFAICLCGVHLGRKVGTLFSGKAMVLGGVILIVVGVEIWMKSVL